MSVRVIQAFAEFGVGDLITDPEAVKRIQASEQVHFVIALPDMPTASEPIAVAKAAGKPKQ
ncbi:Uncharacterised protein [Serratia quinivorans]|jgi:hypothetical protein|uniref:Uncharacterized protein n=1 Tax=Serratia proteamaculans TaxID=28151 RepID=A0ABS0TYK6_SERPR|nr:MULTISPECIES: hypothetical protein [Serratia]MBI6183460.1 hypothetical protein [Serratia proteamaculans]CAI1512215.1 Uncharacterised protein [Serratia quinivorans]